MNARIRCRPPNAGKGRKKGVPNRMTRAAREALQMAFEGIGGVDALTDWARKNLTEFYKLYARLIPIEQHTSAPESEREERVIVFVEPVASRKEP